MVKVTEEGRKVAGNEVVAEDDTPVPNKRERRARYHETLIVAFAGGASVEEASAEAQVSRRTCQRWKAKHWGEVEQAQSQLLDSLLAQLRQTLPAAAMRLDSVIRTGKDDAAIKAVATLVNFFESMSDRVDLSARLASLEAAARAGATTTRGPFRPTLLTGGTNQLQRP